MLQTLIDKIFVNKKEAIILLLKKYHFTKFLEQFITKIDQIQTADFNSNKNTTGSLSSAYLTRINSILETVANKEDKEELEYILSEISNELLFQIVQKSPLPGNELFDQIKTALVTTCEVNNWNEENLFKMIKFDMLHAVAAKSATPIPLEEPANPTKIYYYEWQKSQDDLHHLACDLKDQKVIRSIMDFKKLFSKHKGRLRVKVNPDHLEYFIIIVDQMKANQLIKMKGTKGHFMPLKQYGVDFENKVLIKNKPKHLKEAIVKNKMKYAELMKKSKMLLGLN